MLILVVCCSLQMMCESKPSEHVNDDRLMHLNAKQRSDLLSVLDEIAAIG